LKYWHSNYGDRKVYVRGRRIHHYAIGAALEALGKAYGYPSIVTIGRELKRDDKADIKEAFLFLTREQEEARALPKVRRAKIKKLKPIKFKKFKPIKYEPLNVESTLAELSSKSLAGNKL
jgi:hypothetical protein